MVGDTLTQRQFSYDASGHEVPVSDGSRGDERGTGTRSQRHRSSGPPNQSGAPGTTLKYFGTITNIGPDDPVFLVGDSITLLAPQAAFQVDDTPFFIYAGSFPSLGLGKSSGDIELFDVTVNSPFTGVLNTPYTVSITLVGGSDANTTNDIGTTSLTAIAASSVPEPGTATLLLFGLGAMVVWRFSCHRPRRFGLEPGN